MREWTEQEEQEMIELAKQGDPRANYELSLWALRRGEEEPDESRWNRLAAKCLVKSAQAGYAPAQERMQALLHQDQGGASKEGPEPPEPVRISDARAARRDRQGTAPAPESTARRPVREPEPAEDEPYYDDDEDDDGYGYRQGRGRRPVRRDRPVREDDGYGYDDEPAYDEDGEYDGGSAGERTRWGEKQWRRVEIICVAVCALLLVLIAVMILSGRRSGSDGGQNSAIPPAGDASAAATAGPEESAEPYPDEATLAAIEAADLEVYPADTDYVTVPTTATVKVDSQPICNMEDGTTVQVYAIKNNWSLVYYEGGEDGPVYGWCSSEYLIVTAGAADNSSVG